MVIGMCPTFKVTVTGASHGDNYVITKNVLCNNCKEDIIGNPVNNRPNQIYDWHG